MQVNVRVAWQVTDCCLRKPRAQHGWGGATQTLSPDEFTLSPEGGDELAPPAISSNLNTRPLHTPSTPHLLLNHQPHPTLSLFSEATVSQPQKHLWYVYEAHDIPLKPITFYFGLRIRHRWVIATEWAGPSSHRCRQQNKTHSGCLTMLNHQPCCLLKPIPRKQKQDLIVPH